MKKILSALLALLLITSLVACGTPASTTQLPMLTPTEAATPNIVTFADPALEAMARDAMGKPSGDITVAEAETVTSLNLSFAEWQEYVSDKEPISSIAGLESFTNLESLDLSGNAITDLAPLSVLTNLKALILTGCAAEDYTPLASLTNLRVLMLDHSTIADPTPLLTLTNLKCLYLEGSQIRNYLPLADIYANLELADFDAAFTLSGLALASTMATKRRFIKRTNVTYASITSSGAIRRNQIGRTAFAWLQRWKMVIRLPSVSILCITHMSCG
jgi:hypothetical protein